MAHLQYMPGDSRLVDQLVYELKSKGIFDQFRKDCIADVDTKPAYQNLRQRVESSVSAFLARQCWKPDLNKNQLREKLRKHLLDGNYLEQGVERIVDQVVNPKVASVFIPQVEDLVYNYLGVPRKKQPTAETAEQNEKPQTDLLPTDLEAVSPGSVKSNDDIEPMDTDDSKEDKNTDTDIKTDDKENVPMDVDKTESNLQMPIKKDTNPGIDRDIPLPEEDVKVENIPSPEDSPPKIVQLDNIELPKEHDQIESANIPLPDEKDKFFKPVSDDDSSSDSSLRRNMSPLTPIRNYNNENSCDAQQAFENETENKTEIKELSTFRFSIELKSQDNSVDSDAGYKKENEGNGVPNLAYQFNNQISLNNFNTPTYDDSSNSNNLRIDYESDANSKIADIKMPETDQNSEDCKKYKTEDRKSGHKGSHRSRDSHRLSSNKDKRSDSKHSSSRDSSRHHDKKSSSKDENKSKNSKDRDSSEKKSSEKYEKKDSSKDGDKRDRDSSKSKSAHKSSHRDSKDSKHRSSGSSQRHKSDDKKSSSSSSKDKDRTDRSNDKSKDRSKDSRSSSHRSDKDKDRKSRKDEKEKKKDKKEDDHYSASGRGNHSRRSTDRDSNDGSSSSKGSHNQANSKTSDTKKESKSSSSKSDNTSPSGDSTSPSDRELKINEAKTVAQGKPVVRVDNHLELPIAAPPRLPFVPDVTLKKPKFAANMEEAKRLVKMRKFLDDEQKRMNQEAALLLEFQANVRPSLSQVYSSIPGPELEFACVTHAVTENPYQVSAEEAKATKDKTKYIVDDDNIEPTNDTVAEVQNIDSMESIKQIIESSEITNEIKIHEFDDQYIAEPLSNNVQIDSFDEHNPMSQLLNEISEYSREKNKVLDTSKETENCTQLENTEIVEISKTNEELISSDEKNSEVSNKTETIEKMYIDSNKSETIEELAEFISQTEPLEQMPEASNVTEPHEEISKVSNKVETLEKVIEVSNDAGTLEGISEVSNRTKILDELPKECNEVTEKINSECNDNNNEAIESNYLEESQESTGSGDVTETGDKDKPTELFEVTIITEELSESEETQFIENTSEEILPTPEKESLKFFAEAEKYNAELERHKFSDFLKNFMEKSASNKIHLLNCDTYEENLVRDVSANFGEFEIVNYYKNGHSKMPNGAKRVQNVSLSDEILLPLDNREYDIKSPVFSPVKSECSFEMASDYDAKLEEMVNKTSRQEVMEIILGGAIDESPTEMPTIDYCSESNIEDTEVIMKRKFEEVESTVNNNIQVLTPNKIRKLSDSDHISSTTEEPEDSTTQNKHTNAPRSKYLGKARRVGLPKPKRPNLLNSPSSDKSVENYEQNSPVPNGRIKTPRNKVQRYETSDLYKPKLHYLSRRNNVS